VFERSRLKNAMHLVIIGVNSSSRQLEAITGVLGSGHWSYIGTGGRVADIMLAVVEHMYASWSLSLSGLAGSSSSHSSPGSLA
jgi:hypothetical protein